MNRITPRRRSPGYVLVLVLFLGAAMMTLVSSSIARHHQMRAQLAGDQARLQERAKALNLRLCP